ncbi:hypothetical protein ABT160_15625 [Streptomyces sp. NPDC001941]|uniref:hypothetical protein n=1 Tax=Streptomyces sp. NPDC001941 TaxID=3154659 RepID=UPI003329C8AF
MFVLLIAATGIGAAPDEVEDLRSYRSSRPCAHPAADAYDDCFRTERATVLDTRRTGKSAEYWVELDGSAAVPGEVDLGGDEPLFETLRPGDEVTVTLWRDHGTALERGGVTQYTRDNPEGSPEWAAGIAAGLLAVGAYLVYLGVVLLTRAGTLAAYGSPYGFRFFGKCTLWAALATIPAGMAGAAVSAAPGREGHGWPVLLAVWALLLPAVYAGVRWHERRRLSRADEHPPLGLA